jgi:molecular chaperone DnaK
MAPVARALKDAGLSVSDIDEVILVGGSTRMPRIADEVEKFFGKKSV